MNKIIALPLMLPLTAYGFGIAFSTNDTVQGEETIQSVYGYRAVCSDVADMEQLRAKAVGLLDSSFTGEPPVNLTKDAYGKPMSAITIKYANIFRERKELKDTTVKALGVATEQVPNHKMMLMDLSDHVYKYAKINGPISCAVLTINNDRVISNVLADDEPRYKVSEAPPFTPVTIKIKSGN